MKIKVRSQVSRVMVRVIGLRLVLVLFIKQFKISVYAYHTAHYFLHVVLRIIFFMCPINLISYKV